MSLAFSSPWGGLVALGVVLPLAALVAAERRVRRLGSLLGLQRHSAGTALAAALAICAVALLVGLAAAQPVLERTKTRYVRTDAEAFFVLDTSRSMLAARSANGTTRFERARRAALKLRAGLADVPAGIASLTDRMLPHLFPSSSGAAFKGTLESAVGVERPPPQRIQARATTFYELTSLATQNYFSDGARRRLAIVFTDGESAPFEESELVEDVRRARLSTIFVRFWDEDERVFGRSGKPESAYRPDPASEAEVEALAGKLGGHVFSEDELGQAAGTARSVLGRGPRVARGREEDSIALAPWVAFAALLPLAFLLWRRNLWGLVFFKLPPAPVRQAKPV
jgi:hypothetical protein